MQTNDFIVSAGLEGDGCSISPRNRFPGREILAQLFEFDHCALVSVVAKQQMVGWFSGLDRLDDGLRSPDRITRLFAG